MKRFFLLLFIVLLTGCRATYDLKIDDSFRENMNVTENNKNNYDYVFGGFNMKSYNDYFLTKEFPYHYDDSYMPDINYRFDDVLYYDVKNLSDDSQIGLSLSSNFEDADGFSKSNLLWKTCKEKDISLKDDVLKINVSGFKSFDEYKVLDNLVVTISSKYKVINSNADKVNNGVYTWEINRGNYNDKTVDISFNTSNVLDNMASDSMVRFAFVIGLLCLVGFTMYVFVKKISIRKNRF